MSFYHGTTDLFEISMLLPAIETGNLREDWRKKLTDKVFFTDSLMSAEKFVWKAVQRYGGNAVVYEVRPNGDVWHTNTNEYVVDSAKIIKLAAVYMEKWKEL